MELVEVDVFLKDDEGSPPVEISAESMIHQRVRVAAESSLHDVASLAIEKTGLRPFDYISILAASEPDEAGNRKNVSAPFVIVAEDGAWLWVSRLDDVTVADLERTSEAGLFEGDPRAFTADRGGYGNGGFFFTWQELFSLLKEIESVGGGALLVGGSVAWLTRFMRRHFQRWKQRRATTAGHFFQAVINRRSWHEGDLARFLEITEEESATLLTTMGFRRIDDEGPVFGRSEDEEDARFRELLRRKDAIWDGFAEERSAGEDS